MDNWTEADSVYGISRWGDGHFGVDGNGRLCIHPNRDSEGPKIALSDVVTEMRRKGIALPAVIRFHDILRSRVKKLNHLFRDKIDEYGLEARYCGVYPIKVNQLKEVVDEILDAGRPFGYGIEAGSKPELLAALSLNLPKGALTILNGYKDEDYLKLACLGRQIGKDVIVVIEKPSELPRYLRIAKEQGTRPIIGLRGKLSAKNSGHWEKSSGDQAKFGLSIPEIVAAVQYLKEHNQLDCLKLFHFHIGSQIPDIRSIKEAITEGARIYAKLYKMGCPIEYFDVGGGVGVDYDAQSGGDHSLNYQLEDYVSDVVYILKQICDLEDVPHPNIVSESGRSTTAHHSCVVTNVFGEVRVGAIRPDLKALSGEHILVKNMRDALRDLTSENYKELFFDAQSYKDEADSAFKLGILELEERAKLESMYWDLCRNALDIASDDDHAPGEILELKETLGPKYLSNFSVFQSAIDAWAIDQILPVVPLQRLNERPTEHCTIADITCDSDGKIDRFLGEEGESKSLLLHRLDGQDYHVGIFLTGAYQDIMGDMHNLFGRLNEVHVFCDDDEPEDFYIEETIWGNRSKDVLQTVQYNPDFLCATIKSCIDAQVRRGKIRPRMGVELTDFYEACLNDYTYLKN